MNVLLHSVPPALQQATTNPRLCWRLLDTHRQVWVSLLWGHCSLFLGAGAHKVLLCLPRVYLPVLCKFWQLYGGVIGDLLQEGLCQPKYAAPRAPVPVAVYCWPIPPQEMLKHSSISVSVGSLGPGAHKVCLSPLRVSGGKEV